MTIKKVLVHHVGARDKYLIAKYFMRIGKLARFITDYWINPNTLVGQRFKIAERRFDKDLNQHQVVHYSWFMLLYTLIVRKLQKNIYKRWIAVDRLFNLFVLRNIRHLKPDMVWGYTNANLEVLEYFKDKKVVKVHNQIDPGLAYYNIKQRLWEQDPQFEPKSEPPTEEFRQRIIKEWKLSDIIVVNSEYSKECIVSYGAAEEKIVVLPLIFETTNRELRPLNNNQKLNVGFIGNINLIKGFKVFHEVASQLRDSMEFHAAGAVHISPEIIEASREFITYHGHLSRQGLQNLYDTLDVMLFPTYCDGFGMVQLEAMSNGIPVLATNNCGDVVIDGVNGWKISDANDIITKLKLLSEDRNQLQQFSQNAFETVKNYSSEHFEFRLKEQFAKKGIEI